MAERLELATFDLEAGLRALGTELSVPAGPALPAAVRARIADLPAPTVGRRWWDRLVPGATPVRRAMLAAAVLALVLAAVAGAAVFGLPGLRFVFGPIASPTPSETASTSPAGAVASPSVVAPSVPGPLGAGLGFGDPIAPADIAATVPFPIVMPNDPRLGPPDAIWWDRFLGEGQLTMVWRAGPDLPETTAEGIGAIFTQTPGRLTGGMVQKIIDQGTTVERVSVGDGGYWVSGRPHEFVWETADGEFASSTRRTVGDTLVWLDDGILRRLESELGQDAAMEIAGSLG
jgi:hypothetical protein